MLAVSDDQALGVTQRPESQTAVKVGAGQSAEVQLSHANRAENASAFSQELGRWIVHPRTLALVPDIAAGCHQAGPGAGSRASEVKPAGATVQSQVQKLQTRASNDDDVGRERCAPRGNQVRPGPVRR